MIVGLIAVVASAPVAHTSEISWDPVAVVVDGAWSRETRSLIRAVAKEYSINLHPRTVRQLSQPPYFDTEFPEAFRPITGIAYFGDRNAGSLLPVHFLSVPNREYFERFLRQEVRRRGDGTTIDGSGPLRVLRTADRVEGSTVTQTADEAIAYVDGVILFGLPASVSSCPSASLSRTLKQVRRSSSYYFVNLDAVPAKLRYDLLEAIRSQHAVQLQQRDGETATRYKIRRLVGAQLLRSVDVLVGGVRSFEVSIRREKGFSIQVRCVVKARSQLAQVLETARPSTRERIPLNSQAVMSLSVRAALTDDLQDAVRAFARGWGQNESLSSIFDTAIQRRLEIVGTVNERDGGGLVGTVMWPHDRNLQSTFVEQLPDPLGTLASFSNGRLAGLRLGPNGVQESIDSQVLSPPMQTTTDRSWLRASVDLSKLKLRPGNKDREVEQLFVWAERAFDRWAYDRAISGIPETMRGALGWGATLPNGTFRSLAEHVGKEGGDWRATCLIRGSKRECQFRLDVGRELYRFLLAKEIATTTRILHSVPGR